MARRDECRGASRDRAAMLAAAKAELEKQLAEAEELIRSLHAKVRHAKLSAVRRVFESVLSVCL